MNNSLTQHPSLATQEGGDHYKKLKIQPTEYAMKNGLDACQANIVKYATRHRDKGGVLDLKKVIHYAEIALDFDYPGWRAAAGAAAPAVEPARRLYLLTLDKSGNTYPTDGVDPTEAVERHLKNHPLDHGIGKPLGGRAGTLKKTSKVGPDKFELVDPDGTVKNTFTVSPYLRSRDSTYRYEILSRKGAPARSSDATSHVKALMEHVGVGAECFKNYTFSNDGRTMNCDYYGAGSKKLNSFTVTSCGPA